MGISLCGFSVVFGLLLDPETMPQNYNPSLEDIFTHFITPGMITFGTGFSFVSRDKLDTNLSKKTQAETMVELLEKLQWWNKTENQIEKLIPLLFNGDIEYVKKELHQLTANE